MCNNLIKFPFSINVVEKISKWWWWFFWWSELVIITNRPAAAGKPIGTFVYFLHSKAVLWTSSLGSHTTKNFHENIHINWEKSTSTNTRHVYTDICSRDHLFRWLYRLFPLKIFNYILLINRLRPSIVVTAAAAVAVAAVVLCEMS